MHLSRRYKTGISPPGDHGHIDVSPGKVIINGIHGSA